MSYLTFLLNGEFLMLKPSVGEEVNNAAVTVPRCMILSILINGVLGFAFLIAALFSIGTYLLMSFYPCLEDAVI